MALQSRLFRGDFKLEAAAVEDRAHILPGALGPHVTKIQLALSLVDGARIDQDAIYGSRTAAAVSAYKRKRQIVNFKGQIDNIVGKKTMAKLDQELLVKERGGPLPPLPVPKPVPKPTPKPAPRLPTPSLPTPTPTPPALQIGSTKWRFTFFGNKGFTGKGIYTLFIASTETQDSQQFRIDEAFSSGDLLAGFKGQCAGTFTTSQRIPVVRFRSAACEFTLAKLLGSSVLQGSMKLLLIGDGPEPFLRLENLRDETFGTSVTSGILNVQGRVQGS